MTLDMIIIGLLTALFTAGSYAHGAGDELDGNPKKAWYETKGLFLGITVLVCSVVSSISILIGGVSLINSCLTGLGIGTISALYYWFQWRNGALADNELSFMGRVGKASLLNIAKGYSWRIALNCLFITAAFIFLEKYLYLGLIIPCVLTLGFVLWSAKRNRVSVNRKDSRKLRSKVEIAAGIHGGINSACFNLSLILLSPHILLMFNL